MRALDKHIDTDHRRLGMQLQILSDLHLEVAHSDGESHKGPYEYDLPAAREVLVLLGDVERTIGDGLFDWLRLQLHKFERVLFVAGNHGESSGSADYPRLPD